MIRTARSERGIGLVELVIVVFIVAVISAIATPRLASAVRNYRIIGDARNVAAEVFLAKMRAASAFTESRVYFDTSNRTYGIQLWNKTTNSWAYDSPDAPPTLSTGVSFPTSFAVGTTDPAGAAIAQASACMTGDTATGLPGTGTSIPNSLCIVFNSRSIPINTSGTPTGSNIYITDSNSYFGATISATGYIRSWSRAFSGGTWIQR